MYICNCIEKPNITLSCGDLFCSGCIAVLIYKEQFNENYVDPYAKTNSVKIWIKEKVKCPKCLLISEIGNLFNNAESIKLDCGCILNRTQETDSITIKKTDLTTRGNLKSLIDYICNEHHMKITTLNQWVMFGCVIRDFGTFIINICI